MFGRAIALASRAPRPAGLLGQLRSQRARTAEQRAAARRLLEQALTMSPRFKDARYALALLEIQDGKPQAAIRHLKDLLTQDPTYGEAHLALGRAHQLAGEETAARRAFAAWRRFSDYRRQAAHLELRLRRAPSDVGLLRRMERLHTAFGQPQRAKEYRSRIRALESGASTGESPPGPPPGAEGARSPER
jgi:tetratricopeptide (TPR) repeat protein